MELWLWILVIVLGVFAVTIMAVAGALAASGRVAAAMDEAGIDPAPGWHVYCASCRHTRPLSRVGGVRIGGNRGAVKRTIGRCSVCDRYRILAIAHESRLPPDVKGVVASS